MESLNEINGMMSCFETNYNKLELIISTNCN